jgi:ribulose 1,5-bisphosphate synthetase/thiazole synthase
VWVSPAKKFFICVLFSENNFKISKIIMSEIIIIGAGASGLAAASRLCEHGIHPAQITILEAENRIGGRIYTHQHGKN